MRTIPVPLQVENYSSLKAIEAALLNGVSNGPYERQHHEALQAFRRDGPNQIQRLVKNECDPE